MEIYIDPATRAKISEIIANEDREKREKQNKYRPLDHEKFKEARVWANLPK